jgi:hypothetical protein
MIPKTDFEELAIVIVAKNNNPTIITPTFLKSSGIIPPDWKLAEPPVIDYQMAEVQFTNGIIISAKSDTIIYSQTTENKALEDIQIPTIVRKYLQTLPNADYWGLEINPTTFVTFEDKNNGSFRPYIATNLLSSGAWKEFGKDSVMATINLGYTLEQCKFSLKIDDVRLQNPENKLKPSVLFSGNFPYEIIGDTPSQRLQHLYQLLDNWQENLKTFRKLINQRFFDNL